MRKKSIFFLIIILFFNIPLVYSAGYGEDDPNIEQFVDDYENENNIAIKDNLIRNSTLDCMELNYTFGVQVVYSPLQFREHKCYSAYNPVWTLTKYADHVQMRSTTGGLGTGYLFFVVDREWIDGKYLRWRWYAGGSYSQGYTYLFDGEYNRTSMTDFPDGASRAVKGNGVLQTIDNCPRGTTKTSDILIDASGGTEEKATIVFQSHDAWSAQYLTLYLYWLEINSDSGGADNILTWNIATSGTTLTMEVTGTVHDQGRVYGGDIEDYLIGGYELEGYFYTTEVLDGLNGTSLDLLTNATLDSGTIKVQFSSDNSTWIDHNNETTQILVSGYYGSDFLNGGTASASTEWIGGGYEAWRAFDNNEGTRWSSQNVAFPHWIKYDLGVGVSNIANKLRIKAFGSGSSCQLKDFILQGSNDDSEWTDIISETADSVDSWQEWTFQNDVAYRYYRIWITSSYFGGGNQVSIWEIELMNYNEPIYYGYDYVIEGYETLDLRDLNFTTLYLRFNFTRGGSELTPRLYQIRVITIIDEFVDDYVNENYIAIKDDVIRNSTLNAIELDYSSAIIRIKEYQNGTAISSFQFREHRIWGSTQVLSPQQFAVNVWQEGNTGSSYRIAGWFFITVNREWLDGKYVRFRWYKWGLGYSGGVDYTHPRFRMYDGEYDRSDITDFPISSQPLTKGSGGLMLEAWQYGNVNNWYIKDLLLDTSSGNQTYVTLMWSEYDYHTSLRMGIQMDYIQINEAGGGASNIWTADFDSAIHNLYLEVSGTYDDYGLFNGTEGLYSGGYEEDGYFYTEQVLDGVNGTSLDLLTNSTLNSGDIKVQFSSDNSTWVDHNNQSGYDYLVSGYESIDLRDLNFTTLYMRYNFTRGGLLLTPRLNQIRVLLFGYGAPPEPPTRSPLFWIMLILLFTVGFMLLYGVSRRK